MNMDVPSRFLPREEEKAKAPSSKDSRAHASAHVLFRGCLMERRPRPGLWVVVGTGPRTANIGPRGCAAFLRAAFLPSWA